MRRRFAWLALSCIMVLILLVTSCQQQKTTTIPTGGTTVAGQTTGTGTTTSTTRPQTTTTTPGKEMVLDPATHKMVTKPEYGGTITFAGSMDVGFIDPWNGSTAVGVASFYLEKLAMADWAVDRNVFSFQSTSYFPFSVYRGHIAESWDVVSPTQFIIHIRKGIHWQNLPPVNGRELTAYDVEWSYHRSLGLGSGFTKGSPNATTMLAIPWESIKATDKYTVEVRLKSPLLTALENFLCESYEASWVYPREVIEKYGSLNDWRTCVGSGPFMIADHVVDSSWTYVKNPDYWCNDEKFPQNKLPYVDKIKSLIIPDYQTRLAALRAGKVDYQGADIQVAKTLRQSNPELVELKFFGTCGAYMFDATKPPLDDVRVRTAMQMAINLDEISKTYYEGLADPMPFNQLGEACVGYRLPYAQWKEEWKAGYAYDPKAAKALMAAAGYPSGFKTTFNYFSPWCSIDVLQIVQGYWKELGIELDIKTLDTTAYVGKVFAKSAGPIGSWYAAVNYSPIGWLKVQFWSKNPWSFPINDPAYDALVEKADAATTLEEQMHLAQDCEAYAIPKHWMIVLPRAPSFGFYQPWLNGWNGESTMGGGTVSTYWARAWIDKDLKYQITGLRE